MRKDVTLADLILPILCIDQIVYTHCLRLHVISCHSISYHFISYHIILYHTVSDNVIPWFWKNHQQSPYCHPVLLMSAITSMSQDGLTGSAWGDWANYTASPLRAFENELGVQAPVGFWDPAGFTADGSVEDFKRRRATEIKHGRISMLATMGYITPATWICWSCVLKSFKTISVKINKACFLLMAFSTIPL